MTGDLPSVPLHSASVVHNAYTPLDEMRANSSSDSSFVGMRQGGEIYFGRVRLVSQEYAFVERFLNTSLDKESELWHAPFPQERMPTSWVLLADLPPPIVTAVEEGRVWFLNPKF